MNVLGHYDVSIDGSIDEELVLHARLLECFQEHLRRSRLFQKWLSPITTEGDEVKATRVLVTLE